MSPLKTRLKKLLNLSDRAAVPCQKYIRNWVQVELETSTQTFCLLLTLIFTGVKSSKFGVDFRLVHFEVLWFRNGAIYLKSKKKHAL